MQNTQNQRKLKLPIPQKNKPEKEKYIRPDQVLSAFIKIERPNDRALQLQVRGEKDYVIIISITGCDIFNFQQMDMEHAFDAYAGAEMAIKNHKHKYVFTDSHPTLDSQREHVKYRLSHAKNDSCRFLLNRELQYFDAIERNQTDRQAYLLLYGKDLNDLSLSAQRYMECLFSYVGLKLLDIDESEALLYKILSRGVENSNQLKNIELTAESNYYVVNDRKYCTTLVCNDYPSMFEDLTFAELFSRMENAEITYDCIQEQREETLEKLRRSTKEIDSRNSIVQDATDEIENSQDMQELLTLYRDVRSANERMINASVKIHLTANSKEELEKKIADTQQKLSEVGVESCIAENRMLNEYLSLVTYSNEVLTSLPLQDTYKRQFPFYYQAHIDPRGMYFGQTHTGGLVILDTFLKNDDRNSYDLILIGVKGSGKSVTLKSMTQDVVALGHRVIALDIEGEYKALSDRLGGRVIKLTEHSIINPLELKRSLVAEREDGSDRITKEEANSLNFTSELSRIAVFFAQYVPSISDLELDVLKDMIMETYDRFGIHSHTDVSQLQSEQFPIFSDLLKTIRDKLYKPDGSYQTNITESKKGIYERLEAYLKPLAEGIYSSMFNGYSTVKITEEQMIVFDVSELSKLEDRVFSAVLFQLLSMMWNEICDNAVRNKDVVNPLDRQYVVSLIDEAHRFISANNPQCTNYIEKCVRRSRKYDAGLWFASQSITDFFPSGDFSGSDTIKTIFSLVQYKMILKQSSETAEALHYAFPQFTYSELLRTDSFIPGEMLMHIGGKEKLRCRRIVDEADFAYVGSSRDKEKEVKSNEN